MNEIEVIWKFLDNLDEYVYATDIETDELVYMNRKLLEVYGLQSIDDVKGMKCYEVLCRNLLFPVVCAIMTGFVPESLSSGVIIIR